MRSNISLSRAAVAGVLVVAVSGCSWFRNADELYVPAPENRALEVPPDLDMPRTGAAVDASTGSVTASGTVAAAAGSAPTTAPMAGVSSGFTVPGSREDTFAKVDSALAAIEGVSVASRAELLGVFDVNYQEVNFLVRVSEVEAGAYVSAVDPRGMPATGEAAVQLIAQLQAALGAN